MKIATMKTLLLAAGVAVAATAHGAVTPSVAVITAPDASYTLTDRVVRDGVLERSFSRGDEALYRSVVALQARGFEVKVVEGHPSQLGSFIVSSGQLTVRDAAGTVLWREALQAPLCLPEVFAEFVRAHAAQIEAADGFRCAAPIIKARKVAPLKWRRIKGGPDDARKVYEVSAGSLGMRFLVGATTLTFGADGSQMLGQSGHFEAPRSRTGRAAYLKGTARYAAGRPVPQWPAAVFAPAAPASTASP